MKVAVIREFSVLDAPSQSADVTMNGRRINILLNYNALYDYWTLNLYEEGRPLVVGRKLVLGVDLIERYNLGIGKIICYHVTSKVVREEPNRVNLPNGDVKLYLCWERDE